MANKLSMKRRGVATCGGGPPYMMLAKREKCILIKYIELEKHDLPTSALLRLGPSQKQSYLYKITALQTRLRQLRSGSMTNNTSGPSRDATQTRREMYCRILSMFENRLVKRLMKQPPIT